MSSDDQTEGANKVVEQVVALSDEQKRVLFEEFAQIQKSLLEEKSKDTTRWFSNCQVSFFWPAISYVCSFSQLN